MSTLSSSPTTSPPRKLLLLGLLASVFAVNVIDVFVPLLLPEIAAAFNISIATALTLTAYSALAGVITGFVLSALSIRFKYKTLLMLGVLATPISVLGVYFAPSFLMAQVFYSLNGAGSVIVAAMVPTLIGELYPLSKKAVRVSWSVSTAWIALLIANPITGFLSGSGSVTSWSNSLLWFLLPVTVVSAVMVFLFVPSKTSLVQSRVKKPFMDGYKQVFTNRSAVACLANNLLGSVWLGAAFFGSAFYANVFGFSPGLRGMIGALGIGTLVAGILIGGPLVNSVGRKRLMVTSAFTAVLMGILAYVIVIFFPNVWLFVSLHTIAGFLGGFVFVAGTNLSLEQVPKYRGTQLSLGQGLSGIGRATGVFVGGAVLTLFSTTATGYAITIATLGVIGLTGTLSLVLFAKDPCRNLPQTSPDSS